MQKGIFFNIVDLKKSLQVQNTRKREFTIVAGDYAEHNKDADDRQNKNYPTSRTANSDSSQHRQLSAENSESNKSPDHGNDAARSKSNGPHNDNEMDNASFRPRDDTDVARSPSNSPSPRYHENLSPNDVANATFRSRPDADVAKSPSPQYHDNHSPNENASFRSKDDDDDVAKSATPRYHDDHSPNDPYSQDSVGLSPDRDDHADYSRQHQPVGQLGGREPSPTAAGEYHPQYSNPQYSRDDEYGHDPRAQNNNPDQSSDYQRNAQNMSEEERKKAKSSNTCTLL